MFPSVEVSDGSLGHGALYSYIQARHAAGRPTGRPSTMATLQQRQVIADNSGHEAIYATITSFASSGHAADWLAVRPVEPTAVRDGFFTENTKVDEEEAIAMTPPLGIELFRWTDVMAHHAKEVRCQQTPDAMMDIDDSPHPSLEGDKEEDNGQQGGDTNGHGDGGGQMQPPMMNGHTVEGGERDKDGGEVGGENGPDGGKEEPQQQQQHALKGTYVKNGILRRPVERVMPVRSKEPPGNSMNGSQANGESNSHNGTTHHSAGDVKGRRRARRPPRIWGAPRRRVDAAESVQSGKRGSEDDPDDSSEEGDDEDNGDDESKLEDSCSSMSSKEEQYCLCGGPAKGCMIECDACENWFHPKCVGMTVQKVAAWPSRKPYLCPTCIRNPANQEILSHPLPRKRKAQAQSKQQSGGGRGFNRSRSARAAKRVRTRSSAKGGKKKGEQGQLEGEVEVGVVDDRPEGSFGDNGEDRSDERSPMDSIEGEEEAV
ncbi:unnamed protein product [Vitrella brassicaformis CCMP3155]|uniref:PHD-type domain-containing protein n=3 Tax=Vitrella brassicaformis TaxID=1169539 RepID=A0A0G4ERX8_VITBC|nr:unnamed protein product [Vitrella brassicaformis CCMP3155]|eukprot:CEM00657.1 unnamed protein product [Vitrella brassicaformis CCMP3155]